MAIGTKQLHAAEDDDYLQNLFADYAEDGPSGIKMITKDKAYQCASKAIEKWNGHWPSALRRLQ